MSPINPIKKQHQGFTLVELLFVIIILGILSGIALPMIIKQINKAKSTEAGQNLSICHRLQQAYYAENGTFAKSLVQLNSEIKPETKNYKYEIQEFSNSENSSESLICCIAESKLQELDSYFECNQ
ncbi:MAG: hypothetical protein AUK43_00050 [Oscillatoriales cyanobacterium CG2_30_40_61]|nr:MAG: hypothetical protein AUK43_00050 [Oscillatoriales cyanobacterium CG2_30_40_61]